MRMRIFWGLAAITAIGLLWGCKPKPVVMPPPAVTVAVAVKGSVIQSSEIIGQAKAYDDVDLIARVQGFLTKRAFREGQLVKQGDPLFEIEKEEYTAKVGAAEGALLKSQAVLKNAEIEFSRQETLMRQDATAKRNYDDALYNKMSAQADVMSNQAQLDLAKLNLSYTNIAAPFDGRVGLATYSVGNVVGPGSQKLATIVRLDPVRIEFNVSELDVLDMQLQVQQGLKLPQNLVIRLQFQNGKMYKHEGKISFTDNKINIATGTLLVEAVFPNPEYLITSGMYVKVFIEEKERVSATLIPQNAIQESQVGKYVLVVDKENKVNTRIIKTGLKSGPSIQVLEGISEGEMVITEGLQKVRPGVVVHPVIDKTYQQPSIPDVSGKAASSK